jgi:hypothetical protein
MQQQATGSVQLLFERERDKEIKEVVTISE